MAQVLLPPAPYTRRVSFNNLDPEDEVHKSNGPFGPHEPTQASHDLDVSKLFGNYLLSLGRKRSRLPDAPLKLILKNKLTETQLVSNILHAMLLGVSYHGDLNDLAAHPPESVPRSELAQIIGGSAVSDSESDSEDAIPETTDPPRRKLYSGMTDEELMALDPQFAKPKTLDINNFKFDSTTMYYSPARRSSTTSASAAVLKQVIYPSLNENNYKLISLTVKHQEYDDIDSRTLLSVILGRKHTWNGLDWLLLTKEGIDTSTSTFLQDGDYLVIGALVPLRQLDNVKGKKDDFLFRKAESILSYVMNLVPSRDLRLKITVELILDVPPPDPMSPNYKGNTPTGTKHMLLHLFKQYQPTLVVVGNRSTNLNFRYPLRTGRLGRASVSSDNTSDQFLVKISLYLVKHSPVPVMFVGNQTRFHHGNAPKLAPMVTFNDPHGGDPLSLPVPSFRLRNDSRLSGSSIESFQGRKNSTVSCDSSSDVANDTAARVSDILSSPSPTAFSDALRAVSDSSLGELKGYMEILNDSSVEKLLSSICKSKVHQAYIALGRLRTAQLAQSNGSVGRAYRVKSLISYSEEDEKKNDKLINEKKIRKTLSEGSNMNSEAKKPKKKGFLLRIGLKKS